MQIDGPKFYSRQRMFHTRPPFCYGGISINRYLLLERHVWALIGRLVRIGTTASQKTGPGRKPRKVVIRGEKIRLQNLLCLSVSSAIRAIAFGRIRKLHLHVEMRFVGSSRYKSYIALFKKVLNSSTFQRLNFFLNRPKLTVRLSL